MRTDVSPLPKLNRIFRVRKCFRGQYRPRNTPKMDRTALDEFLKTRKIQSSYQLRQLRLTDRTAPTLNDCYAAFGATGWAGVKEVVWGVPMVIPGLGPSNDREYVIKVCLMGDIRTKKDYLRYRHKNPDIACPSNQVYRTFGKRGFTALFSAVQSRSLELTLEQYLALEYRLGHQPSADECVRFGLDLTPLTKVYGNKWQADKVVNLLRRKRFNFSKSA